MDFNQAETHVCNNDPLRKAVVGYLTRQMQDLLGKTATARVSCSHITSDDLAISYQGQIGFERRINGGPSTCYSGLNLHIIASGNMQSSFQLMLSLPDNDTIPPALFTVNRAVGGFAFPEKNREGLADTLQGIIDEWTSPPSAAMQAPVPKSATATLTAT